MHEARLLSCLLISCIAPEKTALSDCKLNVIVDLTILTRNSHFCLVAWLIHTVVCKLIGLLKENG